jgi:hypothetical protein
VAGIIQGKIYAGNSTIGSGQQVEITNGKNTYTTKTAKDGSYKLNVRENGKCVLMLAGKKELSLVIDSRSRTMTYNLEIVRLKGKYSLRVRD